MAAASSRVVLSSRLTNTSNHHHKPPLHSISHHRLIRPLLLPFLSTSTRSPGSAASVSCFISGVGGGSGGGGGGGVSDGFASTNSFDREFSVIANMLKQIEPLDTSVLSKGVSDSVKESMKQMISTMLGLLPSDQFPVTVSVSKRPLVRMLASSLITGYTMWNAEYRIRLMKNFENTLAAFPNRLKHGDHNDDLEDQIEEADNVCDDSVEMDCCPEELETQKLQSCLADLSPDARNYIQELESELSRAKKDLHTEKQETKRIRVSRESSNDLLKYLHSIDSDMVNELSEPSSLEVKRVLQQLVYRASRRLFKEDLTSKSKGVSEVKVKENYENVSINFCETRDYLEKLLFWCMLLGHQLRGLENSIYLSSAFGVV